LVFGIQNNYYLLQEFFLRPIGRLRREGETGDMPIYEYRCMKCDEEFEALVFGGDDKVACPHCKGNKLERLMSACGFKSGGSFTPASGSSACSSCSSTDCSSCH
jgi:putative FmdB family regulatory protein